jgi:hypothetical protein
VVPVQDGGMRCNIEIQYLYVHTCGRARSGQGVRGGSGGEGLAACREPASKMDGWTEVSRLLAESGLTSLGVELFAVLVFSSLFSSFFALLPTSPALPLPLPPRLKGPGIHGCLFGSCRSRLSGPRLLLAEGDDLAFW